MGATVGIPASAKSNRLSPESLAQLWKNLFEGSPDAQAVCRLDGTIEHLNSRGARLIKLDAAAVPEDARIFDFLLYPGSQRLKEALERQPLQGETIHSVVILADGTPCGQIDVEVNAVEPGRAVVVFKDATRRLRLESHVRRLVTAIDSTPEIFFITDADFRITYVNPAFQTVTGYSIEEVLGRADAFLRAPGQAGKVEAYLAATRQGREWIGELTNARRDGTWYQTETTLSPIFDMGGQFMGYVACERDITERLRLQQELQLESDFIRSILGSLDSAIYSIDRRFCLTHANDGWRRIPHEHGGICISDMPELGRELLDYVPDASRKVQLRRLFEEVLQSGRQQENQYVGPDERHWLLKVSPWVHAGEVRGLICSVSDQTQFHELQSQLFQSQKMEIIGTLAAGVAHDFNNLLQAIRGNISLVLLQAEEGSNLHHCAEQINLAAARAAEITQQLLSFSRASAEKDTVLDLNEVVREAGQLARRTLRGNVTLDLNTSSQSIPVKVDATRAHQALLNLCVNAQDAMPHGGKLTIGNEIVQLTPDQLERHGVTPGMEFARCTIADTGCGIPREVIDRIFEPFFTTKAKGKGTGLGLPIVLRVLKEAGGFVEVDSLQDQGTSFHLYFPVVREAVTTPCPGNEPRLARGTGRVLVVDDLDLLRDFTRSFLQAAGLTVLVAGSGPEALQVLENSPEPVDLLFTDYSMPGMNGLELIEKVASRWPRMHLVLALGYLDESTLARLENFRVSVLCKPYDTRQGSELIIRLLSESQK